MHIKIDEDTLSENSRLTAIALTTFTMRCMENWKHSVSDYDRAMILVAIVAITSERLLRTELSEHERQLSEPIAGKRLAKCNISSIASATGINRETVRRKVATLVGQGLLIRSENGSISFAPGVLQRGTTLALVRRQLEAVVRLGNELVKLGVIRED